MNPDSLQAVHLVISHRSGNVKVACGSRKFLLATLLTANVTCDDCIAYMTREES